MNLKYRSLLNGNDRILLYLLDVPYQKRELKKLADVPDIVTSRAIAEAVLLEGHSISKLLKKLLDQEYIESITTRVKGKARKQKIYFLTSNGRERTKQLKDDLMKQEITIMEDAKKLKSLKFSRIAKFLNSKRIVIDITDLELCKLISNQLILDINLISQTKQKYINYTEDAPELKYFYGRVTELQQLKSWIDDKKLYRIINVYGVAGIGKTTLASKLIEEYKGRIHIFWHNINEWDTIRSVLIHLAEFLAAIGNEHLITYLEVNRTIDQNEILKLLKTNLRNIRALLIFDDLHKAKDDLKAHFRSLIEITDQAKGLKFIILTRAIIKLYDQRKVMIKRSISELELEGLDFASSIEILHRKGLPKTKYRDIYKITSGNPLLLEINESYKTSKRYIYEEIFSQLTRSEQRVVEILSAYKIPIRYDAFFVDDKISPGTIEDLVNKLIIKETSDGLYDTHEFIRDFFYKRLSPHNRRKYHKACAEHYNKQRAPKNYLEIIYHYIRSQQYKEAIKISIEKADNVLTQKLSERFFTVLEELPEEEVPLPQWVNILMLKAQIKFKIGDWDKAIQFYYMAVEVSNELGNDYIKADAYCEIGHIREEQNKFEDVLHAFKISLKISKELKDSKRIAEAIRGIGRYYWRTGDYKTAEKYLKESLKVAETIYDIKLMVALNIDLGNIYITRLQQDQAIKYLEISLKYLKKVDDKLQLARAYNSLGSVYIDTNKYDVGINYYKKQLTLLDEIEDIKLSGYALSNIGYCYAKLNRISEAEDFANKAKENYEKTHNENILFQILRIDAVINHYYHNWDKAIDCFDRSIKIAEKLNVQFLLSPTLLELGKLYEDKGDPINARFYLEKAKQVKDELLKHK